MKKILELLLICYLVSVSQFSSTCINYKLKYTTTLEMRTTPKVFTDRVLQFRKVRDKD